MGSFKFCDTNIFFTLESAFWLQPLPLLLTNLLQFCTCKSMNYTVLAGEGNKIVVTSSTPIIICLCITKRVLKVAWLLFPIYLLIEIWFFSHKFQSQCKNNTILHNNNHFWLVKSDKILFPFLKISISISFILVI